MNIPDYMSPIIAYRTWQWDALGLRSLNQEQWFPGQPLAASCRAKGCHCSPCLDCSCGVYAAKNFRHLQAIGYSKYGIHGEAYLWGTVVEHRLGYRAQFAYPKNLVLPLDTIPFKMADAESRLQTLLSYGVDLFVSKDTEEKAVPLWSKEGGFNPAGFDYLINVRKKYYDDYLRERTLKPGDRVALLGKGIALVAQAGHRDVRLTLWNRVTLKLRRRDIAWNPENIRWEAEPEVTAEAH